MNPNFPNANDNALLDKIRALFVEAGGSPLRREDFGIGRETSNNPRLEVFYGNPHKLLTQRGRYTVRGNSSCCDGDLFFNLLKRNFKINIISDVLPGAPRDSNSGYTVELFPIK